MMGLPTSRIGDSNAVTLEMGDEIWNVVENTPLIAGVEGTDPTRRDLERLQLVMAQIKAVVDQQTA